MFDVKFPVELLYIYKVTTCIKDIARRYDVTITDYMMFYSAGRCGIHVYMGRFTQDCLDQVSTNC